ncbi:transmembrane protein 208-like [Bombus impatiens]|uniref:Transmembrane protein 208-like n=1 Tax=Bombus impatiens TaxID=132113 RepID=A0A6P8LSC9_BOMIM|nr:transmembrane protein 208-like [Bombus impatiens]
MTIKKTKAATKGAKQIVEENKTTLNFYQNMIIGAIGIYFTVTMLFFNFTTLSTVSFVFSTGGN